MNVWLGLLVVLLLAVGSVAVAQGWLRRSEPIRIDPQVILDLERISARRTAHRLKWAVRRETDRARRDVVNHFRDL